MRELFDAEHLRQLALDQPLELLGLGALVALGELGLQRLEVDLRQVDQRLRLARLGRCGSPRWRSSRSAAPRHRSSPREMSGGSVSGADLGREVRHQHGQRRQLVGQRVGQDGLEEPRHPAGQLQEVLLVRLGGQEAPRRRRRSAPMRAKPCAWAMASSVTPRTSAKPATSSAPPSAPPPARPCPGSGPPPPPSPVGPRIDRQRILQVAEDADVVDDQARSPCPAPRGWPARSSASACGSSSACRGRSSSRSARRSR